MANLPATLTLAELYERQGLRGKARLLYRELLGAGDQGVRAEAARRLEGLGPSAEDGIALLEELLRRVKAQRRRS